MDYTAFCRNYFALTNIPLSLIQGKTAVYSSIAESVGMAAEMPSNVFWENGDLETNPTFGRFSPEFEYGCIHIEHTDYYVAVGPVFSVPVTDELINAYMKENWIPMVHREDVAGFLHAVPRVSRLQFYRHVMHLHMSLNGADVTLDHLFLDGENVAQQRQQIQYRNLIQSLEETPTGNSYKYEQQLYLTVRQGDLLLLDEYLKTTNLQNPEGTLALSPLRHAKNLFIQYVTKVGLLAGIPAGINVNTVYRLTEMYIQECEKLQSIGSIQSLHYAMLQDFCQRCAEAQLPEKLSSEVYRCLVYIHTHIGEPISVADLTAHVGRSSSYLTRRFKEELGTSINACIMDYKLHQAKRFLTYTDKSLAEISYYFGFSSQSYFQNVFKKAFGITPGQYRKDTQKG